MFCFVFSASDTLWDIAKAEVEKRESHESDRDVLERSLFFIGNKNGVTFLVPFYIVVVDNLFILTCFVA